VFKACLILGCASTSGCNASGGSCTEHVDHSGSHTGTCTNTLSVHCVNDGKTGRHFESAPMRTWIWKGRNEVKNSCTFYCIQESNLGHWIY